MKHLKVGFLLRSNDTGISTRYTRRNMTKTVNRIVRGVVALAALGLAAQHYMQSGFSMTTVFIGIVGVVFGWMAATGQG